RDPNDTAAPIVSLSASLRDAKLANLTNIVGSVSDTNLDFWRLQLTPLGSSKFTQVAGGTAPVANGPLAQLEPGALANGPYQLQLTAADITGRVSTATYTVQIVGSAKPNQFLFSATDLMVQLGGATVSLARQYDSLAKD